MTVSLFRNARSTTPISDVSVDELLADVRKCRYRDLIESVRSARTHDERKSLKAHLPAATFSGRFKIRSNDQLIRHSGIVVLDFDDVEDPAGFKKRLQNDAHVFAAFVSPGGKGLKLLVRVEPIPNDDSQHKVAFNVVSKHFGTSDLDASGKDVARLCFLSMDPDLYFHEEAESIRVVYTSQNDHTPARLLARETGTASPHEVRELLRYIPARPEHDEWVRVIAGVLDGLGGSVDEAEMVLKEWSPEEESGEYRYKLEHSLESVSYGTVVYLARQNGYVSRTLDRLISEGEPSDIFDNIREFSFLTTAELAKAKQRLKIRLKGDLNLNDLTSAINRDRVEIDRERLEREGRPTIELGHRESSEVVDDALRAIEAYNDPPVLFQRSTDPVRVLTVKNDRPIIAPAGESVWDDLVHRAAVFIKTTSEGVKPAVLPMRYIRRMMTSAESPLPALEAIIEAPVMRPDGSVLDRPGYDPETRLLYLPAPGVILRQVADAPNRSDVNRAKALIREPICNFPFVDEASEANMVGLMLTPFARPMIGPGNVPMAGIDSPMRGTGKTLLVDIASRMASGRGAATMNAPESDDEWRKQITALLYQGSTMIIVDNVRKHLASPALEQALTTSIWCDRILGASRQVELPQRATWVATGNNLTPGGDMIRRMYMIRIDSGERRPWMRTKFKHEDLGGWVSEHRGELVWAALTLLRAWHVAGRPKPTRRPLGSFEMWTQVVGGMLEFAGIGGFLENLTNTYDAIDDEDGEWATFLSAIYALYGDESFQTKKLADDLSDQQRRNGSLMGMKEYADIQNIIDHAPDQVQDALSNNRSLARTLGRMFGYRRDRRFGIDGWFVTDVTSKNDIKKWQIGKKRTQES